MLEKLFTSKNRIKILQFLLFEKHETYLREIAKELKISTSAVKREIENLINLGIITKQRNKLELNKKSNILDDLKNIFIKTDAIAYPIKETLKDKKIEYALIFGSFARGEYKEESDVDLLVIGDIKRIDFYKKIKQIEDKIKREINPSIWTTEDLTKQKNTGFVK
ncbi:MAG: nucleotidyltransferase domain-containing protein, partial [Nanoarchaeota archaeon]